MVGDTIRKDCVFLGTNPMYIPNCVLEIIHLFLNNWDHDKGKKHPLSLTNMYFKVKLFKAVIGYTKYKDKHLKVTVIFISSKMYY